jgi:hypothetical protein
MTGGWSTGSKRSLLGRVVVKKTYFYAVKDFVKWVTTKHLLEGLILVKN